MNVSELYYSIKPFLGLKIVNGKAKGVMFTKNFEGVKDYGAGVLDVKISLDYPETNFTGLTISTIDDGAWQAEITNLKKFDLVEFVEIFDKKFGYSLPTEEALNDFLRCFGMFGMFTG